MNQDQINSLVRTVLKIAGTALAARGLTSTAQWVNSEDVFGLIVLLVGLWESHQTHQNDSATGMVSADRQVSPTTNPATKLKGKDEQ